MADQEERTPYTVKGLPRQTRETIVRCSRQTGETQADWLAAAVENEAGRQRGTELLPPQVPDMPPVRQSLPPPVLAQANDLQQTAGILNALSTAATAHVGNHGLQREIAATTRMLLRGLRGLPPRRPGHTLAPAGQTETSTPS